MHIRSVILCSLISSAIATNGCAPKEDRAEAGRQAATATSVTDWARANAHELGAKTLAMDSSDAPMQAAFGKFIRKEVQIVGVGEAAHGTHEYNQLRARFFKYLAANHQVRTIVPETGFVEAQMMEDYVQGRRSDLETVLRDGMTHGMGEWAETKDLAEWMRAYNDGKAEADRLHFSGKDLPATGDTLTVPITPLHKYLQRVDATFADGETFQTVLRLSSKASALTLAVEKAYRSKGAQIIEPDYLDGFTQVSFEQLTKDEQQALRTSVGKCVAHIESQRDPYVRKSSNDEYEWNKQLAVFATHLLRNLVARQTHPKITFFEKVIETLKGQANVVIDRTHLVDPTKPEDYHDYFLGRNAREESLAENVQWVNRRYGRLMNFAHNGHLSKVSSPSVMVGDLEVKTAGAKDEGTLLAERFGAGYVLIASTHIDFKDQSGKITDRIVPCSGCPPISIEPRSAYPDSIENAVAPFKGNFFFLDLATAPPDVAARLKSTPIRWQYNFQSVQIAGNYDGLLVFDAVGPGHPLPARQ